MDTPTRSQILEFRDEAETAGDLAMVAVCNIALDRTVTGWPAIALASNEYRMAHTGRVTGNLRKYSDPTEGARSVTLDEAREIAKEDPNLIYLDDTSQDVGLAEVAACIADSLGQY